MSNDFIILSEKKLLFVLGTLTFINLVLFIIPGLPGSIQTIVKNAPNAKLPDMRLIYSPQEISGFLKNIGSDGRKAFQMMHITIDLTFPLLYGLFFYSMFSSISSQHKKVLPMFGFLPTVFDLLENFTLILITNRYPAELLILARLTQISTWLKFTFILLNIILIAYLGMQMYKQKRSYPKKIRIDHN